MMKQDLLELERLIDRGETAAALPMLEEVVTREPGFAAARLLLARAYEGEGRHEDAVRAWRLVRVLVPDSPTAMAGLKRALRLRVLWSADPDAWEEASAGMDPAAATSPAADEPGWDDVVEEVEHMDEPAAVEAPAPDAPAEVRAAAEDQNLDDLIRELESARIVPDPSIQPVAAEDIEPDVEDVVSETLARIYENQKHYDEAARVYTKLASQQPARATEFMRKAADARARADA